MWRLIVRYDLAIAVWDCLRLFLVTFQDAIDLLVKAVDIQKIERYVQLAYLFHPYVIASCGAKTTTGPTKDIF